MSYASRPTASFGYYRGGLADGGVWQGQGSGMGPATQGTGILSQGQGPQGVAGWHPTVLYLVAFVIGEMIVFGFISRMLK
jgi:hypothetical protein